MPIFDNEPFVKKGESYEDAIKRHFEELDKLQGKGSVKTCTSEKEGEAFAQSLRKAKSTQPTEDYWRVDTDSHDAKDYVGTKTFISEGGSTFAIKDGDIISVCRNANDKTRGHELLDMAVKAGGNKLDSFDGNFAFYVRNGFEPISWTAFDENYKPKGWDYTMHKKEPVVFFKYTGTKYDKNTPASFYEKKKNEFYKNVKMSKDYDTAMAVRDKEV